MKKLKGLLAHIPFLGIAVALALVPSLYTAGVFSASSTVVFLGKCCCFAIVAIGLDLIWGYTGILSLGHGLFYCLGGYAMAMYLKMQATGGKITEFMHTGGLTELPAVWKPFLSLPMTLFLIVAVPGCLAWAVGYFVFRNRVRGVYFSIISQALTWAAYSLFIALSPYTNGNIGITEFYSILGSTRGTKNQGNLFNLYYAALIALIIVYTLASWLVGTKFGKLLIAIRDGENRAYFSGYRVSAYKTFIYVVSAVFAAIAGAFFANFNGSIAPQQMTIAYSINIVIWVAIGGRGTILGAVIGAFAINLCEYTMSSGNLASSWQFILGGIFCVSILFFRGGIVGLFTQQIPALVKKAAKATRKTDPPKVEDSENAPA